MACSGRAYCDYSDLPDFRASIGAATLSANCLHCGMVHVACGECALTRTVVIRDCGVDRTWFKTCPKIEKTLRALED